MIELLDSTLRDGAQAAGIAFSLRDKLGIIETLDRLGVGIIEAGNPFSNPKDAALYREAVKLPLAHARLSAFGMTRRPGSRTAEDANLQALLAAETPVVSLVGKASRAQVQGVLMASLQENLDMISESVAFLAARGREVVFDAEHFFDACREDEDYALRCLMAARDAGAAVLCLCDTRGGCLPQEIARGVRMVREALPGVRVGIHAHDDCGLAVAVSLEAVQAGAVHLQGTLLGFGERCGNANLAVCIADLAMKLNCPVLPPQGLRSLTGACRKVAEIANIRLPSSMAYVGGSAFAHKGGMHIDGVLKDPAYFEHIDPAAVGNSRRLLASEMAGRALVLDRLGERFPELGKDSPQVIAITRQVKERESLGCQYEDAEASLELIIQRALGRVREYFTLQEFKIITDRSLEGESPSKAVAVLKVAVGGKSQLWAAEGQGPVHAMDLALRGALETFYPALADMRLLDYKVRVIDSASATAARVRVLIQSGDGASIWNTVGASADIIEASWQALVDSIVFKLMQDEAKTGE